VYRTPDSSPGRASHSFAVNKARESTNEKDKGGIHSHPRGVGDNVA